jgi:Flp pilus assembly protein CpaB
MSHRTRNILIAIALAVVAAVLVTVYARDNGKSKAAPIGKEQAPVVIATRDIPIGTPASELGGKVRSERVPRALVVPGAISSQVQVQGKVTTQTIYKGEQVTAQRFQPLQSQGLRGQITGNLRAIEVPGDANQLLAGTLKPNDRVDVVANIHYQLASFRNANPNAAAAQGNLVATRIVLRNIRVLTEPVSSSSKFGGGSGYSVILALTDNQAQKLFFVLKNGDWTLDLRPAQHATDSPDSVETTGSILADGLRAPQFGELVFGTAPPG